jgi:hypothetical protein
VTTTRRARALLIHIERTGWSAILHGPVRVIHPAIRQVGCYWQFDHTRRTYEVPAAAMPAITSAIEVAGHIVKNGAPTW